MAFEVEPRIRKDRKETLYTLDYKVGGRYLFIVCRSKNRGIASLITAMDNADIGYLLAKSIEAEMTHTSLW